MERSMDEILESPLDNKDKKRKQITIGAKCKSCIFYKDRAYQAFKKPCAQLGVKQYSRPCQHFFANPYIFLKDDPEFNLAKKLLIKYEKQLPTLVAWLNQELSTKKTGFTFGQIIYVKMIGEDYLQNYARATVVSANKEVVYVQGDIFRGTFMHASIFTEDAWVRKKKNLIKHKRIRDPKEAEYYKIKIKPKKAVEYEVPTIDTFAKTITKKKVGKVLRVNRESA